MALGTVVRSTDRRVASAFHTLPLLGGIESVTLNRPRCEALVDEVTFVAERLNDAW